MKKLFVCSAQNLNGQKDKVAKSGDHQRNINTEQGTKWA